LETNTEEHRLDAWEEEVEEALAEQVPASQTRSWADVRREVDMKLKKNFDQLGQTEVNQLMVLRVFATLQMKGVSKMDASHQIAEQWQEGTGTHFARCVRALARHYKASGKLLRENCGGARSGRLYRGTSLLLHKGVEGQVRVWLTTQKVGSVTPQRLAQGLENEVFPSSGITPLKPLTQRTAQRWLIQLGWRHSVIKKGVYKDGHDREDVITNRETSFLAKDADLQTPNGNLPNS
jgi:hypothetical protein